MDGPIAKTFVTVAGLIMLLWNVHIQATNYGPIGAVAAIALIMICSACFAYLVFNNKEQ